VHHAPYLLFCLKKLSLHSHSSFINPLRHSLRLGKKYVAEFRSLTYRRKQQDVEEMIRREHTRKFRLDLALLVYREDAVARQIAALNGVTVRTMEGNSGNRSSLSIEQGDEWV